MTRTLQTWAVGEYILYHVKMKRSNEEYYTFSIGDAKISNELYPSLDEAMVAAVGEKYTGKRGAGGTAVGTAADWFMSMIGAR